MNSPKLHVSASSLRTLQECPREFAHRYLWGHPQEDRSSALVLGSAVHKALQRFYEALQNGEPEPDLDELMQVTALSISKALVGDVPVAFGGGEDAAWLISEAERVLEAFLASPYRPSRILGVEARFALVPSHPVTGEVPEDFEEMLIGVFDLVCLHEDGYLMVIDHKINKRLAPPKATTMDLQSALYCWAGERLFERPVRFFHQVLVRTKTARVELVEIPRQENDAAEAVEAIWSGIARIHLAVAHPHPMRLLGRNRNYRCSAGCGYRSRCAQPDESAVEPISMDLAAGGMT